MCAVLVVAVVSCSPPSVEIATRVPAPTPTVTPPPPPTSTPDFATPAITPAQQIERVTFASGVDRDGSPIDERTVVPELPELIYLCVLMRQVDEGTRFRAYWFQGDQIIGQSDVTRESGSTEPAWVALRYRPIARLNPAVDHSVELRINDVTIDRYLFRVGVGALHDAVAEAAFASGFDLIGKPVDERTLFSVDETSFTLLVRISNQVDPTGMSFTTAWYRGDAQIARINPDAETVGLADSGEPDPRRLSFTFTPTTRLVPGEYRVVLFLNGAEVRSIPFGVTTEPVEVQPTATSTPTPEPEPTATPTPEPTPTVQPTETPTAIASNAVVRDMLVATSVDPSTNEPDDGPIFTAEGEPGSSLEFWIAVSMRDVAASDLIEIELFQDGSFYSRVRLPQGALESGWLATEVEFDVPNAGQGAYVYTVSVLVNGQRTLDTSVQVHAITPP